MSYRQLSSRTRMELQFHPGPARKLSTNLYDIYQLLAESYWSVRVVRARAEFSSNWSFRENINTRISNCRRGESGWPVGGKVFQSETSPLSRPSRRLPFMISVEMALCLETRHARELYSNVTSAVTWEGLGISLFAVAVLHFHKLKNFYSSSSEGPATKTNMNYRTGGFL
jgi:hypothetical protein